MTDPFNWHDLSDDENQALMAWQSRFLKKDRGGLNLALPGLTKNIHLGSIGDIHPKAWFPGLSYFFAFQYVVRPVELIGPAALLIAPALPFLFNQIHHSFMGATRAYRQARREGANQLHA